MFRTLLAAMAALSLVACVDFRAEQRRMCDEAEGRYIQASEFDDDLCLLPSGEVMEFDD